MQPDVTGLDYPKLKETFGSEVAMTIIVKVPPTVKSVNPQDITKYFYKYSKQRFTKLPLLV